MADARAGQSYGVRLSLGERSLPPAGEPPIEIAYADAAANRGSLAWCDALAAARPGGSRASSPRRRPQRASPPDP